MYTKYWQLHLGRADRRGHPVLAEVGLDRLGAEVGSWYTEYPGRPDTSPTGATAFRYAASVIGLPMGDYPDSRPPQGILPEAAKAQIRAAFENAGWPGKVLTTA